MGIEENYGLIFFLGKRDSGVGRMVDACHAQGVPGSEYEVSGRLVRIVFKRSNPGMAQSDSNLIQKWSRVIQRWHRLCL